jgi:hypothetical protein
VTATQDGKLTILAVLEGAYQADAPKPEDDTEVFSHLIEAETREEAEAHVRDKYFPKAEPVAEEPPC